MSELIGQAMESGQRLAQGQVTLSRKGRDRNLSVRVTSEQTADAEHGYVVTLDDITELVSAQRTSAWADVARRIAHEIKNPLTPIQLSAERLRRKYGKVIVEDRAIFEQCTDTIVRQVDDIRRMVDEFSRFARMPKPVIAARRRRRHRASGGVPDAGRSSRCRNRPVDQRGSDAGALRPASGVAGADQHHQERRPKRSARCRTAPAKGRIVVTATREGGEVNIDVIDNGIGLPTENRSRLLEPYVTTREKGTGLGLAIVGKILEEHGGGIELHDAAEKIAGQRGAWVRLRFAVNPPQASATNSTDEDKIQACGRWRHERAEILIVDDEPDICELVAGILQDEGYSTRTARDGDDALNAIKTRRPNLRISRHLAAGLEARRPAAPRRREG